MVLSGYIWAQYGNYDLGSFQAAVASDGTQFIQIRFGVREIRLAFNTILLKRDDTQASNVNYLTTGLAQKLGINLIICEGGSVNYGIINHCVYIGNKNYQEIHF